MNTGYRKKIQYDNVSILAGSLLQQGGGSRSHVQ